VIRVGMVGVGKMGLSHLAIINSHSDATVVGACDANSYITDVLAKHTGLRCYADFEELAGRESVDAVIISTPTRSHANLVEAALRRGLHVFCEKPFVLNAEQGISLVQSAESQRLANQVGYHFRFVAAFAEAARIARSGALGTVHHVRAEAYGPVVLRPKGSTWRSRKDEGGGALYDYACHAIDLVNFVVGEPTGIDGVVLKSVFSRDVDDEVYCSMSFENGATGQLAVNWSDESYRRMFTRISVWGDNGRLTADRQECQVYLRQRHSSAPDLRAGWTVRYTTDLTDEVWYYLRGEEYSAQLAYFVQSAGLGRFDGTNCFRSALATDRIVSLLQRRPAVVMPNKHSLLTRVFG
jgi:scyllo-inositol 2-dehydrogenase (NADP+)